MVPETNWRSMMSISSDSSNWPDHVSRLPPQALQILSASLRKQAETGAVEVQDLGALPITSDKQIHVARQHVVLELFVDQCCQRVALLRISQGFAHAYTLTPRATPIMTASSAAVPRHRASDRPRGRRAARATSPSPAVPERPVPPASAATPSFAPSDRQCVRASS